MPKIVTFLMFNDQAEEAMKFYTSIFKNSKITSTLPGPDGKEFSCYNGGSYFSFAEGMSIYVECNTQADIDYYWDAFSAGAQKQVCGWIKDKFGVSWQFVPSILNQLLFDKDSQKAKRTMDAMLEMEKLDIQKLKDAHAGR